MVVVEGERVELNVQEEEEEEEEELENEPEEVLLILPTDEQVDGLRDLACVNGCLGEVWDKMGPEMDLLSQRSWVACHC